jgi:lipoate-protein ligase A
LTGRHSVRRGSPEELHEIITEPVVEPHVVLCVPNAQAAVVGSRQSTGMVTDGVGMRVIRRRSGGGLVLVDPDMAVWIDLLVPPSDARFGRDVRTGMIEVGRLWCRALIALGADPDRVAVHEGGMRTDAWGELLCFSGTGPGEVLFGGAKLVGISQRRSSSLLRFQCQVHCEDPTDHLVTLINDHPAGQPMRPAVLADAVGPAVDGEAVAAALAAAL